MPQPLDYDGLVSMLRSGAARVRAGVDELARLDSAIGDGDHGVAMGRAMDAIEKGIDGCTDRDPKSLVKAVAWAVMSIDAGSTGPLVGSLLLGMVDPAGESPQIDASRLAAMFEAGRAKLLAISKAQVGDKTMVDALVPAVDALRRAAEEGDSVAAALQKAAGAARRGAESTTGLQAKFGKARNLGPRSVGHQDPGATSIAMLLEGFAESSGQWSVDSGQKR